MNEDIKAIVRYRVEQAEESLKDATILFDSGGGFRSIINRSYYAMFYATLALIAEKGTGRSKHSGVRFGVRPKRLPKDIQPLVNP